MLIKLCGRQIDELPPGHWTGVARLSRGTSRVARVVYEGPATIDVQYAIFGRLPTVPARLGDPMRIAALRVLDHAWPSYNPQQHLRADGSLVDDTFILELFDEDRHDLAGSIS